LVLLAKLNKSQVGFASNHGTMPPFGGGAFAVDTNRLAKLGKKTLPK
jgi:hypothetical protein